MTEHNITNSSILGLLPVHFVAIPLYFTFGVISLIGNIVFILSMKQSNLINYGGYLTLAHSAITDIIFGCLNVFFVPWSIALQMPLITPRFIPGLLLNFALYSKKVFLVFMALTKFYAIVFPIRARQLMTINWYKRSLCVVWVSSAFVTLPLWLIRSGYVDFKNYKWTWEVEHHKIASTYWAVTNLIAIIIFLITYPVCFYKLRKNNCRWMNGNSKTRRNSNELHYSTNIILGFRETSVLYIFVVDAIVFTVWCIPPYLYELGKLQIPYFGLIKEISRGLLMCYSPIVYWILNKNIRTAINRLLCRQNVSKVKHLKAVCRSHTLTGLSKSTSVNS